MACDFAASLEQTVDVDALLSWGVLSSASDEDVA